MSDQKFKKTYFDKDTVCETKSDHFKNENILANLNIPKHKKQLKFCSIQVFHLKFRFLIIANFLQFKEHKK